MFHYICGTKNSRLHENDIKFRIVRQIKPNAAYQADTIYYQNPEEIEKKTKQLEVEQLAIAQAEAAAKEIKEKADRAKERVLKLKKGK